MKRPLEPDLCVVTFNAVPRVNLTRKYTVLGELALINRRQWCARHGYRLIEEAQFQADRPACWAKFGALLQALQQHKWVLWADSDALVLDLDLNANSFLEDESEFVTQDMDAMHLLANLDPVQARARFPVNTGVFLLQSTAWIRDLLTEAAQLTQFAQVPGNGPLDVWNGIGDQEAIIETLKSRPEELSRIKTVEGLHCHPRLYQPGKDLFVHFYGNNAAHRIPAENSEKIIIQWQEAIANGESVPDNLAEFHWCCIQNTTADAPFDRGGPDRFLYDEAINGWPDVARKFKDE